MVSIVVDVATILIYTRESINKWLLSGQLRRPEGKMYRLTRADRIFMTAMVLRDIDIKMLELLWGLSQSSIWNDSWLVARVILQIKGGQSIAITIQRNIRLSSSSWCRNI